MKRPRRNLLACLSLGLLGLAFAGACDAPGASRADGAGTSAERAAANPSPESAMTDDFVPGQKVVKTDADWQRLLTPEQYRVTRQKATERPFTGEHCDRHDPGLYRCVCCKLILFDARTKFSSGTGWPSYFQPITRDRVTLVEDRTHGMARTEVLCARCDAHLGHVFDDGPPPTGQRYCINSVSLEFVPVAR